MGLAGFALVLLAFAIQLQDSMLSFCAGEVRGGAALCTSLTGFFCMALASKVPYLSTETLRQRLDSTRSTTRSTPSEQDNASATALVSENSSGNQVLRRRDVLYQKISGICGLHS